MTLLRRVPWWVWVSLAVLALAAFVFWTIAQHPVVYVIDDRPAEL